MGVFALDKPQKFKTGLPYFAGHTAAVLDFDFYPFNESLIASASEDAQIKLWEIPEDGLTKVINTPLTTLSGHSKKVMLIKFHPTASNVIVSVS